MPSIYSTIWIAVVLLLNIACTSGPNASNYAQTFCSCSEELGLAQVQKNHKKIDQALFLKIQEEQSTCLGKDNPFETCDTQADSMAFYKEFLAELEKQCPSTARNLEFNTK